MKKIVRSSSQLSLKWSTYLSRWVLQWIGRFSRENIEENCKFLITGSADNPWESQFCVIFTSTARKFFWWWKTYKHFQVLFSFFAIIRNVVNKRNFFLSTNAFARCIRKSCFSTSWNFNMVENFSPIPLIKNEGVWWD